MPLDSDSPAGADVPASAPIPDRRQLRARARAALDAGIQQRHEGAIDESGYSIGALIQDLRIYQAELEIQNEQLRDTQHAAQDAARRFSALFAGIPMAVLVVESYGLVTHCNPAATRLFGLEERHLRQNFLLRLVEREDQDRVASALNRSSELREWQCSQIRFRASQHQTFLGDLHLAHFESSAAGSAQYICAVVDQTALNERQGKLQAFTEQLRLSEHRLGSVIDAAPQAIIGLDPENRIVVFNPAAQALFGCPLVRAREQPLELFFPDAAALLALARTGQHGAAREWPARNQLGKTLSVDVVAVHDADVDAELVTLFVRDLSEIKAVEAQRSVLELQLLESQKMQAVGTLAGGIAHDFNNMLGAILGNLALARQDAPPGSALMESLVEIEKASLRARNLVRQILAFSRRDSVHRERLALADIIAETVSLVRVGLPPGVELHAHLAPDLPPIDGDPTQVQQAIMNLCTNALDAVRAGGRVHISARGNTPDEATCRRLSLEPGLYAAVRVTDNGAGMTPEVLRQVFEPFFTTKPVGHGTGLGLSVVHGAMRTHRGAVQAESQPGLGSTFTLYFPAAQPDSAAAVQAAVPAARAEAAHGERVMYVDDDEALVFLVERMLRRQGYQVSGYSDPDAALAALANNPRGFDLMLTDYNMPGMSGLEVARRVKAIRGDLPLVLCSGYLTPSMEAAAEEAGVDAVMHKPNQAEDLMGTIRETIDRVRQR